MANRKHVGEAGLIRACPPNSNSGPRFPRGRCLPNAGVGFHLDLRAAWRAFLVFTVLSSSGPFVLPSSCRVWRSPLLTPGPLPSAHRYFRGAGRGGRRSGRPCPEARPAAAAQRRRRARHLRYLGLSAGRLAPGPGTSAREQREGPALTRVGTADRSTPGGGQTGSLAAASSRSRLDRPLPLPLPLVVMTGPRPAIG